MKAYRLAAWPELRGSYDRTAFRRLLSDMSHRHVTVAQLAEASGMRRHEVQAFVDWLGARGLLDERDHDGNRLLEAMTSLAGWPGRTWRAAMRGD